MYLAAFAILRTTGRRSVGELAMLDFIVVHFLALAADRAMMGDQTSIGSGFVTLQPCSAGTTHCTGSRTASARWDAWSPPLHCRSSAMGR